MNERHFIPSRVTSLFIIIVFFTLCLISMANANQVLQKEAEDMVVNRELILEYRYYSDDIIGDNKIPRVRVYQDGLVLVHYPVYMKRTGYYTLTLTPDELQNLVNFIVSEGLFQFNQKDSLAAKNDLKGTSFIYHSHSMRTEVTAYPAIKQVGVSALVPDNLVTVQWKNIKIDAQQYGDSIVGLKELYRISQRFESLADRAVTE